MADTTPAVRPTIDYPSEVNDPDGAIRISGDAVATGFDTVKFIKYQSYIPEYPTTDNSGFAYCVNVGHLSNDDVVQCHKQVRFYYYG
jgi:hypothetical protein